MTEGKGRFTCEVTLERSGKTLTLLLRIERPLEFRSWRDERICVNNALQYIYHKGETVKLLSWKWHGAVLTKERMPRRRRY